MHLGSRAAIAQVDLSTETLDYTRVFAKAHVITAISEAPEASEANIVALATIHMNNARGKAFLFELTPDGEFLRQPMKILLKEFAGRGDAWLAHASISFDA